MNFLDGTKWDALIASNELAANALVSISGSLQALTIVAIVAVGIQIAKFFINDTRIKY
tara:strand:- start:33 stop:206 length:174 start_codon:yes stop_codon:yes gene_type:complete